MQKNRALPGWCGILDRLISEVAKECPDNKDGMDVVSEAPSTPTGSEHDKEGDR